MSEDEVLELEKQYIQTMDKILKKKKRLALANAQYKRTQDSSQVSHHSPLFTFVCAAQYSSLQGNGLVSRLVGLLPGGSRPNAMQTGTSRHLNAFDTSSQKRILSELDAIEQETSALENFARELFLEIHHLRLDKVCCPQRMKQRTNEASYIHPLIRIGADKVLAHSPGKVV